MYLLFREFLGACRATRRLQPVDPSWLRRCVVIAWLAVIVFKTLTSRAVLSTSRCRSSAKSFSAFFITSAVFSFCSESRVFIFAVCLSLIKFTVSCFRNFLRAFVRHLSCFARLLWLSPSDWLLLIQDSLLFCWNSCSGVVSNVSQ